MAYRGGGRGGRRGGDRDRGDQRQPYGGGGGGGGGGRCFVWPPPVPAQYQVPIGYRPPAPAPPASPVTIRAPPSSASSPAPSAAPAPRQLAQGAPERVPESAPSSSAPSAAALVKEVEKKLFVSETALAPPAAAAAAAVATAQGAAASDAEDVDLAPVSKKGLAHPARPGLGTVGKKVMICANHFLVDVTDNNLFHYDVAINPESKSRQTNREVLNELIKLHGKTALGGKLPAYDGRKSLYTAGPLPFESEEFVVTLIDPEKKDKERAEREYKITIRIAGRTDLYHLHQFLRGRQRDMPQETIQVLDVVLRESPSWNYVTVSRSFFSTTFGHRGDIGEGLECWRGYYQSLRPTQMGLSLNIDISATSFFKPVTVIKFVEEFLSIRDTSRPLSDRDRVKIKKALRGVRIETSHQQDQIRRYKVTGITPIPMSQLIFPVDEKGTRQTVVQYFWDKYNYRLKYSSWPCLQAGSDSRPVYLPMEVCKIVEGQRYSKKLNDRQVTNILRATCKRPQERELSIRDMVLHNKYAEDKFAQEFGINVCSDLVTVPARVLPPPLLKYHDSGREKTCAPSIGQWNMINKKMINGGTIDNWTCLNFSRMRPEEVQRFCMDLTHMCNATGMNVNPRPFIEVKSAAPNHIENALRDVHRRATQMVAQQGTGNQLQLLIVILPDVSGSYGKIKRVCETEIGIVSQCCLPKHASRPNKQYLENIALKINVKVGGRNTVLERAFVRNGIPFVSEVPTIIFGADVTHPPPGEDSASSIAAVVASMDWPEITKYRGLVSAQPHRQEIIEDLFTVSRDPQKGHNVNGGMIRELLIAFRRKTSRRPERIIFYRDGVSEGQFSHVLLHEMDAIRKACASLEEGYLPPVTFVVVQKRHHTKLFPEVHGRRDMTDKSGNILLGTVVDQKICHAGIQGTSRPTHYHVLNDENHFTANALQSLTNNLCYTYARCTHAVSVVPPTYYAHLAAFRARYYVEGECLDCGSTLGSSGQAVAPEGPVEVRQHQGSLLHEVDDIRKDGYPPVNADPGWVNFKIYIDSMPISVTAQAESPLESAIYSTLMGLGIGISDCYFLSIPGRKPLRRNTPITEGIVIEVNFRLVGGCSDPSLCELETWIYQKLEYPFGFFEYIQVPKELRRRFMPEYVVCLGPYGLLVLELVLQCLERDHSKGRSYNGQFTLKDFLYDTDKEQVILKVKWDRLTMSSYKNDLVQAVIEVFDRFLKYENELKQSAYPMLLGNLVQQIRSLKEDDDFYRSPVKRSLIHLHPATWNVSAQIECLSSLIIKYHSGFADQDDRNWFETLLRSTAGCAECTDWSNLVNSKETGAASGMLDVYTHLNSDGSVKHYPVNFIGRTDFSRCALHHCKSSSLQMLAALYLHWKDQLPVLHRKLMVEMQNKLSEAHSDDQPPDSSDCQTSGSVSRKRKGGSSGYTPQPAVKRLRQGSFGSKMPNHPNKDGSFGPTGYIKLEKIPYKTEIKFPEIFGYRLPTPRSAV